MSGAPLPTKIKLVGFAKKDHSGANGVAPAQPCVASQPPQFNGAGPSGVGAGAGAPGPTTNNHPGGGPDNRPQSMKFPLPGAATKIKLAGAPRPAGTGPPAQRPLKNPNAQPKMPKAKRSAASMQPAGAPLAGPAPKKFKLAAPAGMKVKLNQAVVAAAAPPAQGPPRPAPGLPGALYPVPGPKKRGRKRKSELEALGPPPPDEVNFNIQIAALPPRQHSLRQSASLAVLANGGDPTKQEDASPGAMGPLARRPSGPPQRPELFDYPLSFPPTAPSKEDLVKLLQKLWEKDTQALFHKPVTEDLAPQYFTVIKQPMDLTTMRQKAEAGSYDSWGSCWEDLDLMFINAMHYNPPGDKIHAYAMKQRKQAMKFIQNPNGAPKKAKAGGGGGGKKGVETADKKARAAKKAERDAAQRAARAEQKAAQEAKVLRRAGVDGDGEEAEARATYRPQSTDAGIKAWGGLGAGANAEGAAIGIGRQMLKPSNAVPSAQEYAISMLRFAAGLTGRARDIVLARVAAVRAASDAVVPPPEQPASALTMGGPGVAATSGKSGKGKGNKAAAAAQQAAVASRFLPAAASAAVLAPPPALSTALPPPPTLVQPSPSMAAQQAAMMAAQAQMAVGSGSQPTITPAMAATQSMAGMPDLGGLISMPFGMPRPPAGAHAGAPSFLSVPPLHSQQPLFQTPSHGLPK